MLKNFFKFGKKKKGKEEQKSELENQLDKEIQESEDEIQKIKKETEKERKKREKEELKFMTSGKSIFERSALMSKFKLKYQERMETIRKDEDEVKENNHTNDE